MKYAINIFSGAPVIIITIFLLFPVTAATQDMANNCIDCHRDLDEEYAFPATRITDDIHYDRGIMCIDCHGGDSQIDPEGDPYVAKDPKKGYTGVIQRSQIPQFCDRCHGDAQYMGQFDPNLRVDQYQRYKTSIHGQRIAAGDEKAAVCTDCHLIHQMRRINDPLSKIYPLNVSATCGTCHADTGYMQSYAIPADQVELYYTSVHYEYLSERGDLSAPTCNDCHGNHGAVPPGFENIHYVCGSCHISAKELFDKSTHSQAFRDMDLPECVTCHSNHDTPYTGEHMLSLDGGICGDCHDTDSEEGKTTQNIVFEIETLKRNYQHADSLITLAEIKGIEVSEYKISLIDLASAITTTRNLVHSLSLDIIQEETQPGNELAEAIITGGNEAMTEINRRRAGLFISLLFILIFIFALYLKIRSLPPAGHETQN